MATDQQADLPFLRHLQDVTTLDEAADMLSIHSSPTIDLDGCYDASSPHDSTRVQKTLAKLGLHSRRRVTDVPDDE